MKKREEEENCFSSLFVLNPPPRFDLIVASLFPIFLFRVLFFLIFECTFPTSVFVCVLVFFCDR